jgi:hypothetical protein
MLPVDDMVLFPNSNYLNHAQCLVLPGHGSQTHLSNRYFYERLVVVIKKPRRAQVAFNTRKGDGSNAQFLLFQRVCLKIAEKLVQKALARMKRNCWAANLCVNRKGKRIDFFLFSNATGRITTKG